MDAFTPAFSNAFLKSGASCVAQRTDDFVSGNNTQTSTDAVRCFVLAVAVATRNTARPKTARPLNAIAVDLRKTFLKVNLSFIR
jgi:hypothetical protein